jgi:hypothetical protein
MGFLILFYNGFDALLTRHMAQKGSILAKKRWLKFRIGIMLFQQQAFGLQMSRGFWVHDCRRWTGKSAVLIAATI